MPYLINNITFQNYEDLSVNIRPERINLLVKKVVIRQQISFG